MTKSPTKNVFASQTVQGLLAALLGQLWARLGWGISDAETLEVVTWIVSGAGFVLALYGRIKTRGEVLTLGTKGRGALAAALLLFVAVAPVGCGVSSLGSLSAVEQARVYVDVLMSGCDDIQDAYETKWAASNAETRADLADVGKAINTARDAIALAAEAVITWSQAADGDTAAAQASYEALYESAQSLLAKATVAWTMARDADTATTATDNAATTTTATEGD